MISHGEGYWQRIRQNIRAGAYDVWGEAEGTRFVEPGGDEQGGEEGMEVLSPTSYRRLWKGWSPTLLRGALQKGKRQQSQVATREIPAVFLGKEVTELTAQPWKSCSRDSDLSDSGSVQESTGQGPEPAVEPGKFGLLGAVDRSRRPPEVHSNLCYSGVH